MKIQLGTDFLRLLLFVLGIGVLLELLFNPGALFTLLFAVVLIYIGVKQRPKVSAKILIVFGVFLVTMMFLHTVAFKFSVIAFIAYSVYKYQKMRKQPHMVQIKAVIPSTEQHMNRKEPYIKNILIGNQRIVNEVYEIDNINIHCGIGDTIIDLGMTMLPLEETVIVIRGLVGNIQLLIPYDVDISIHHSVLLGKLKVFGNEEECLNKNVIYYSESYGQASRRIKILTSTVVGDLEVRNV
jgi:lia operon protein LiaF